MKRPAGKVFLVGAGPGAPDLITLRAAEILKRADVVFHDALVHPAVLSLASRAATFAVGKRCGKFATAQQFINKRLVDAARKNEVVVRLKGGDPMLFGRAQEEIAALAAAGIPFEVVPGVTAALAASAELGVSLTQRGVARSVAFVTARVGAGERPSAWADAAARADSAVIYMGVGQAGEIAGALIERGWLPDTPVAIIENASLPSMRCVFTRLANLHQVTTHGFAGPVLIMAGAALAAMPRVASGSVSIAAAAA